MPDIKIVKKNKSENNKTVGINIKRKMGKSPYTVLALRDKLSASLTDGDFLILKHTPPQPSCTLRQGSYIEIKYKILY